MLTVHIRIPILFSTMVIGFLCGRFLGKFFTIPTKPHSFKQNVHIKKDTGTYNTVLKLQKLNTQIHEVVFEIEQVRGQGVETDSSPTPSLSPSLSPSQSPPTLQPPILYTTDIPHTALRKPQSPLVPPKTRTGFTRTCDMISNIHNPEYFCQNAIPSSPNSHPGRTQQEACAWYSMVKSWQAPGTFPGKAPNVVALRPWTQNPITHTQVPKLMQISMLEKQQQWGDVVYELADKKEINSEFLEQFIPGGCLSPPHEKNQPETMIDDIFLRRNHSTLLEWDELAKNNKDDELIKNINSHRLTFRNKNVILPQKQHVPLLITGLSSDKGRNKLQALLRNAKHNILSFEEAHVILVIAIIGKGFKPSIYFQQLVTSIQWIRHVSVYFAPIKQCWRLANIKQPNLQPISKVKDGFKSWSIDIHWIWSNNLLMNQIWSYNYVVTMEDDVSKFKECSSNICKILTFLILIFILFLFLYRWNTIAISICTTFLY